MCGNDSSEGVRDTALADSNDDDDDDDDDDDEEEKQIKQLI